MKNSIKKLSVTGFFIINILGCCSFTLQNKSNQVTDSSISLESENNNFSFNNITKDALFSSSNIINTTLLSSIENTENIEDNRKVVALTFDDGPSKYTEELLDVLNEYNIHSTFFVLEYNCITYPDTIISMSEQGHEIAIHGSTHTSFTKLTIDEIEKEIASTIETIENLGVDATEIVRPPYGSLNNEIKENIDYPFMLWSIDTEDWKSRDKDEIKKQIVSSIRDGSIILMHDTSSVHEATIEALKELLPELTEEYRFVTISELYEHNNIELENGKTYGLIKKNEN